MTAIGDERPDDQPPQLEARQLEVWRTLQVKSTDKYRLADWYLGALSSLRNTFNPDRFAQSAHSLRELLEKIPRALQTEQAGITGDELKNKRRALRAALEREKTNFPAGWENQPITAELSNVLSEFEQYFELCERPDRKDQVFASLTRLDPMIKTLPEQLRREKRERYVRLWNALEGIAHHGRRKTEEEFREYVLQVEELVLDLMAPVSAEDQHLLAQIIAEGDKVSAERIQKTLQLIGRRGANFAYFFKNVSHKVWLKPLREAGYFKNPPGIAPAGEGFVSFPVWWPGIFLERIAPTAGDEVADVLSELPNTDNPRVLEHVVKIALAISDDGHSQKLAPIILNYLRQPYHIFEDNLTALIARWAQTGESGIEAALRLCEPLISFQPDPRQQEKSARAEKHPDDWTTSLNPSPRFQEWEYQQILENGVRPLAKAAPLRTAKLLIDAVAQMVRLETGKSSANSDWRDASAIWAPRVSERRGPYSSAQSDLIAALTDACEKVYEQGEGEQADVEALDLALRNARWQIFNRIRHYLYGKYPARAKAWIAKEIINYPDYSEGRYEFEFQRMVRIGIETFGESLLSRADLTRILDAIYDGPDKAEYQQFMGKDYTEQAYGARKQYFQLRHFRPFSSVLFGKYKSRYDELCAGKASSLTDEDFVPYSTGESKTGTSRSPRSVDELAQLSDDELIAFLNEWEDVSRDPEQWWVDIDFHGVGIALQQLITASPGRFLDWGGRWREVQRPIYFRYALDIAGKRIVSDDSELAKWFDLADWVMAQKSAEMVGDAAASETSRTHPEWDSARRQVVDLVETCVAKEQNIGIDWRERIRPLITAACSAADPYLDKESTASGSRDYLTTAINTTRGRALETLLDYGYWVRRHCGASAAVSEVFQVLETRFQGKPPLTLPERALLGGNFSRICGLNFDWAKEHVSAVFDQSDADGWRAAFGTFLVFNRAHPTLFEVLRPQLEFALEKLRSWPDSDSQRNDPVANLGEHLLDYYLLGRTPLQGKDSLLQRFYNKASAKRWATLFDHAGRLMRNTAELSEEVANRCKAFFESRLQTANGEELQEVNFLIEANCLDAEWRLRALSRVLDVTKGRSRSPSTLIKGLGKLLADHTDLVVECFAKVSEGVAAKSHFYLRPEDVKPILKAGLASQNPKTSQAAEFALDNLLKAGRSEFLNLDQIKDDPHWLEPHAKTP